MATKQFRAKADEGWTKQSIWEQLHEWTDDGEVPPPFEAEDMADEDVQEWVEAEFDIRDRFPSEDRYCVRMEYFNETLCIKTLARKLENDK